MNKFVLTTAALLIGAAGGYFIQGQMAWWRRYGLDR